MLRLTASLNSDHTEAIALDGGEDVQLKPGVYYLRAMLRNDNYGEEVPVGEVVITFDNSQKTANLESWIDDEGRVYGAIANLSDPVTVIKDHTVSASYNDQEVFGKIISPQELIVVEDPALVRFKDLGISDEDSVVLTRRWNGAALTFDESTVALKALAKVDIEVLNLDEMDALSTLAQEIRARREHICTAKDRFEQAVNLDG